MVFYLWEKSLREYELGIKIKILYIYSADIDENVLYAGLPIYMPGIESSAHRENNMAILEEFISQGEEQYHWWLDNMKYICKPHKD